MTLPPLQFPRHSLPEEVGLTLPLIQDGLNSLEGSGGEAANGLFVVDLGASSRHGGIIDAITNYYKSKNRCYHLLTRSELLLSSIHQNGRRNMTYRAEVEGFSGHFATVDALKEWAERLNRRFGLTGKTLKVWQATWIARDGSGASYAARPTREIVIGA